MSQRNIILIVIFLTIFSVFIFFTFKPPSDFPLNTIFVISEGSGLNSLANNLKDKKIIKSTFLFKSLSVIFAGTKGIIAGDYFLDSKENVISIASRMTNGDYHLSTIKVTIPEGLNIKEISIILSKSFSNISADSFVDIAKEEEGYLFPDTYFFLPNIKSEKIISEMKKNFNKRLFEIKSEIDYFDKPLSDIIKVASIVEEEARTEESRKIVAGILWRRLALGMPLQVDSSFKYINGKTTKDLSLNDLKIDSLYNSYLYKGLPPTPICNPGLSSIKATVNPIDTPYLYFLTDDNGNMHYAKTHAVHLQNKELYLK